MANHLIAYNYDIKNKIDINKKDINEIFENSNISLSKIDRILCRYSKESFIEKLEEDEVINGQNRFIIECIFNKNVYYKPVLFNHPEMKDVIDKLEKRTTYENGHPVTKEYLRKDSPFFIEKFSEFMKFLGQEPDYFFSEIYGEKRTELERKAQNYFTYYVKNNLCYTNEENEARENSKREFLDEFSKYETIREYIINVDKFRKKQEEEELNRLPKRMPKPTGKISLQTETPYKYMDNITLEDEDYEGYEEYKDGYGYEEVDMIEDTPEGDEWYDEPPTR